MFTEIGQVELDVPRDTNSTFDPVIVKKRQRRLTGIDEIVLSLTAKGLTTGEIAAHVDDVYGATVSKDTISRITDKVIEEMTEWCNRPLESGQSLADVANLRQEMRRCHVEDRTAYRCGSSSLYFELIGTGIPGSEAARRGRRVDELWLAVVYRCWQREHHRDAADQFPATSTKTIGSRSPTVSLRASR